MDILQGDNIRQLRAAILQIIYSNQVKQRSRLRFTPLYGAVARLFFDVSENELLTVLQDMKERGYLVYERDEEEFKRSRKVVIGAIQILPRGRDLVERTESHPAVCFE